MSHTHESCYHLIFDASPLPAWISAATTGRILVVNDAALHQYGYSRDEFLALSVDTLRRSEARTQRAPRPMDRPAPLGALATDRVHRTKTGVPFAVRLQVVTLDIDGASAHLTLSLDAAPRDAALAERELRLVEAQRLAHVGSWETNHVTGETSWSRELYRLYGASPDVTAGLAEFLARVHEDDRARVSQTLADAALKRPLHYDLECRIVLPDGSVRWLGHHHVATYDAAGSLLHVRGTVQDITPQRVAEQALGRSERQYRLLAENATAVVTEIDPTGTILHVSPSVRRLLDYARADLVGQNVLAFTHPDDAKSVTAAIRLALAEPGVPSIGKFRVRHRDGSWRVLESIGQAEVESAGAVSIVVHSTEGTERRAAQSRPRSHAEEVAATTSREIPTPMHADPGLTDLVLNTDRTPLHRRLRDTVQDAGGLIPRRDLVGATTVLDPNGRPSRPGAGAAVPLRILLAADNLENREAASSVLRQRGHHVTIVGAGPAAVSAVTTGSFDLVMMDIQMPVTDGLAATRAIRALPGVAMLPIVAVTADASSSERENFRAAGLDDHLSKPYTARALIDLVEGAASRRRVSAPVDVVAVRAIMRDAGGEDGVDGVLDTFLGDAPRRKASVLAALESGDDQSIRVEARGSRLPAAPE